jgi:TonB family protein
MAKVGGMVILEAVVGADGKVESVQVLRSVKFLDRAALDAVKQWQYSPLVLNGIPTPFILTVTLNFRTVEK